MRAQFFAHCPRIMSPHNTHCNLPNAVSDLGVGCAVDFQGD